MQLSQASEDFENTFTDVWIEVEKQRSAPQFVSDIVTMPYVEFEHQVMANDQVAANRLVEAYYTGTCFILKDAFDPNWLQTLIQRTHAWGLKNPASFHKLLEGCPDFNRAIGRGETGNYSLFHIKQSFYYFPWNDDPLELFEEINKRWRIFKLLGGLPPLSYENNTPVDEIVDRIQIVRYPAGGGILESHTDPTQNQRIVIGALMSERGVHYDQGGFYLVREDGSYVDCEPLLDVGDLLTIFPTIIHGVAAVDPDKELQWGSKEGRWFLGLYSNDSDHVPKRVTTKSLGEQYPSPSLPKTV